MSRCLAPSLRVADPQELYTRALRLAKQAVQDVYSKPIIEAADVERGVRVTRHLSLLEVGLEYAKRALLVYERSAPPNSESARSSPLVRPLPVARLLRTRLP